jgi:hypothetical protein
MGWMLSPVTTFIIYPSSMFKATVCGAGYKGGISSVALCLSLWQAVRIKMLRYASVFFRFTRYYMFQ